MAQDLLHTFARQAQEQRRQAQDPELPSPVPTQGAADGPSTPPGSSALEAQPATGSGLTSESASNSASEVVSGEEPQPEGEAGAVEEAGPESEAVPGALAGGVGGVQSVESALQSMAEHLARAAAALGLGGEVVSAKALEMQVPFGTLQGRKKGGGRRGGEDSREEGGDGGEEEEEEGEEGGGEGSASEEEEAVEGEEARQRWAAEQREIEVAMHRRVLFVYVDGDDALRSRLGLGSYPLPSLTLLDPHRETFYSFPATPSSPPLGAPLDAPTLTAFLQNALAGRLPPGQVPVPEAFLGRSRLPPPPPFRNTDHREMAGVPRASIAQLLSLLGLKEGVPPVCQNPTPPAPPPHASGVPQAGAGSRSQGDSASGRDSDGSGAAQGKGPSRESEGVLGLRGPGGRGESGAPRADVDVVYYGVLFTVPWCGFCRRADLVLQEVHRAFLFFSELYRGTPPGVGGSGRACDVSESSCQLSAEGATREQRQGPGAAYHGSTEGEAAEGGARTPDSAAAAGRVHDKRQTWGEGVKGGAHWAGVPQADSPPVMLFPSPGLNFSLPRLLRIDCSLSDCRSSLAPMLQVRPQPTTQLNLLLTASCHIRSHAGQVWCWECAA